MPVLRVLLLCLVTPLAVAAEQALPDPTRPPTLHSDNLRRLALATPQTFVVSAIKIGEDGRKAIVNDQLVKEGERLGEATVVEIAPGTVVIDYLSQRRNVRLLPFEVRRTPRSRNK